MVFLDTKSYDQVSQNSSRGDDEHEVQENVHILAPVKTSAVVTACCAGFSIENSLSRKNYYTLLNDTTENMAKACNN